MTLSVSFDSCLSGIARKSSCWGLVLKATELFGLEIPLSDFGNLSSLRVAF